MPSTVAKIRIFVASPGDVQAERDHLNAVVAELNTSLAPSLRVSLELVRWETHTYPAMGRPQGVINQQICGYDVFVGIMWKRFGTPTGEADSGTEEEFQRAYRAWQQGNVLKLMFYFSESPYTPTQEAEVEQFRKVVAFREDLRNKCLVWTYSGPDRFADVVRPHLTRVLLELCGSDAGSSSIIRATGRRVEERVDIREVVAEVFRQLGLTHESVQAAVDAEMQTALRVQFEALPLAPACFFSRQALVQTILTKIETCWWVSVIGMSGIGKTQLAREVFESWNDGPKLWVNFRAEDDSIRSRMMDHLTKWVDACGGVRNLGAGHPSGRLTTDVFTKPFGAVRPGFLVILDDLPDPAHDASQMQHLLAIASLIVSRSGRVISTSQHGLGAKLLDAFGSSATEIQVPLMDLADVKSLLSVADAPNALVTERFAGFLLGLTQGHPSLLAATARWLREHKWSFSNRELEVLLRGEPLSPVKHEERRKVRTLITDEKTRGLVDRLSLLSSTFDLPIVTAVGAVEPAIDRPEERLHDLIGPWIQALTDSRYEVSPLLRGVGKDYLAEDLQQRAHGAVANTYLSARTIDAADAIHICSHLFAAREWTTLAGTLLRLMQAIQTEEQAQYLDWTKHFFKPKVGWPAEIPTGVRLVVRALQVRQLALASAPLREYELDLEELIGSAQDTAEEMGAVAAAHFYSGILRHDLSAKKVALHAIGFSRAIRRSHRRWGGVPEPPEVMFWSVVPTIKALTDLQDLSDVLRQMSREERLAVFSVPFAPEMTLFFVDSCYATETENAEETRDWKTVFQVLDQLSDIGQEDGVESLIVAVERARAIILADYCGKVDEAVTILREVSSQNLDSSRFIIEFTQARMLLAHDRPAESFEHFRAALATTYEDENSFLRFDALMHGIRAAGATGRWQEAGQWCAAAIHVGSRRRGMDPFAIIELLGEMVWIHWQLGNRARACAAAYGALRRLVLARDEDQDRFSETCWKLGHVLGWLSHTASTGRPPTLTLDEDVFLEPFSGFATRRIPALAELRRPQGVEVLLGQLGTFAVATGCLRIARWAYDNAVKAARQQGLELYAGFEDGQRSALEALFEDFDSALVCALNGARAAAVLQQDRNASSLFLKTNLVQAVSALPDDHATRFQTEFLFWGVLWPVFIQILDDQLQSDRALQALERLSKTVLAYEGQIRDVGYVRETLRQMTIAYGTSTTRKDVLVDLIDALSPEESRQRLVLYLALSRVPDVRPADSAILQAITLTYCEKMAAVAMIALPRLRRWVVRYWRSESAHRGFRLSIPRVLRDEVATIPESSSSASHAARVLLAAALATNARLEPSIADDLRLLQNR